MDLTQEQRISRTLGRPLDGVLQGYIVVPAEDALSSPGNMTDEEAATLPIAALTAWNCLQTRGVGSAKSVLVQGTGGVALFALQFAKALDATVIALTSFAKKAELLRDHEANHVINYRDVSEWAEAARNATDGKGIEIAVIGTHDIHPIISERFSMSLIVDAFRALESAAQPGKIVIRIG